MRARSRASTPLRVLHVIDALAPGGAERMLVELVRALDAVGVSCEVCVTRDDLRLAPTLPSLVPVHALRRRGTWDLAGFRRFGAIVRSGGFDVIHAHGYSSATFVVVSKAHQRLSIPLVLHGHSSAPPPRSIRLAARFAIDHFIAASPAVAEWGRTRLRLPPDRVTLLGNAIDPTPYLPASRQLAPSLVEGCSVVALAIANVRPAKQLDTLLRALAAARRAGDVGLAIAGSLVDADYVAYCRALVAELGLEGRVRFLGERDDLPTVLAGADIGVLSSSRETGPVALLEYMAAGLPFVATRVGQVAEVLAAAGMPGLVAVGDEAAFARELDALLALDPAEREARGERGRALLMESFDLRQRAERLRNLYETLGDPG